MNSLGHPWDDMHDHSLFLPEDTFTPITSSSQCIVDPKDFIPHHHVDWFKHPILSPHMFEEGNMANIFPIVKVEISATPSITKNILLRASCSAKEVFSYRSLFKGFCNIFTWSYLEIIGPNPTIFEHQIYKKSMAIKVDIEKV